MNGLVILDLRWSLSRESLWITRKRSELFVAEAFLAGLVIVTTRYNFFLSWTKKYSLKTGLEKI
jgi:hypothetical protein